MALEDIGVRAVVRGMGSYTSNMDRFNRANRRGERGLNRQAKAADRVTARLKKMRLRLLAASAAITALGVFAVKAASDLVESQNKANEVFGGSINLIEEFAETSANSFGISRRAAFEYTGTLGTILAATGIAKEATAGMSVELVKLSADIASFNNLPIDDALRAIRSGLVGEVEPLRRVGVLLSAVQVETKALELGLIDVNGELTEAAKVQARYALILEQTSIQQGDAERTNTDLAGAMRRFKAQSEDLAASLGGKLIPVATKVFSFLNDMVGALIVLPGPIQSVIIAASGLTVVLLLLGVVIPPLVTGIKPLIGALIALRGAFFGISIAGIVALATVLGTVGVVAAVAAVTFVVFFNAFMNLKRALAGDELRTLAEDMALLAGNASDAAKKILDFTGVSEVMNKSLDLAADITDRLSQAQKDLSEGLGGVSLKVKDLTKNVRDSIEALDDAARAFMEANRQALFLADFEAFAGESFLNISLARRAAMLALQDAYDELAKSAEDSSERQAEAAEDAAERQAKAAEDAVTRMLNSFRRLTERPKGRLTQLTERLRESVQGLIERGLITDQEVLSFKEIRAALETQAGRAAVGGRSKVQPILGMFSEISRLRQMELRRQFDVAGILSGTGGFGRRIMFDEEGRLLPQLGETFVPGGAVPPGLALPFGLTGNVQGLLASVQSLIAPILFQALSTLPFAALVKEIQRIFGGGMQFGGSAINNGPVLVGERGPELLSLPSGSTVTPTAGGDTVFNVTANYTSPQEPQSIRMDLESIAMAALA